MPATAETTHDVVVLGGGSGGYACALRAAQLGMSVALVEKDLLGGTCLHRGCIPTKALLHAAEVADAARDAGQFGVRATLNGIDMPAVTAYREGVVGRLHKGLQGLVTASRMDYVEGEGRLEDGTTVVVGDRRLVGRHVVLATGSYARTLPGLEIGGRVMTSDEAIGLDHVPDRVVVLGGGVIGVELASAMRSFGAEVTIVEALPRLVAAEEPAVSKALERAFRKRGITVRTGMRFDAAKDDGDAVTVRLDGGDELVADILLVAVGRGPVHRRAGLRGGRGDARARLRRHGRAVPHLGGRCVCRRRHRAGSAARAPRVRPGDLRRGGHRRAQPCPDRRVDDPAGDLLRPRGGLRRPHGGAGPSRSHGDEVQTVEYNLGGNGKSQILRTAGFVKLVRVKDGPVVGVHMVGSRIGEQVGEAQLVVGWEAHAEDVAGLVHAHPTQNEALGEAHLALAGKPLHAHN